MWDEDGDGLEYKATETLEEMLRKIRIKQYFATALIITLCLSLFYLDQYISHLRFIIRILLVYLFVLPSAAFFFSLGMNPAEHRIEDILKRRERGEKRRIIPWLEESQL